MRAFLPTQQSEKPEKNKAEAACGKGSLLGGTLVVKFQSFQPVLVGKASESDQCVGRFVYHSD